MRGRQPCPGCGRDVVPGTPCEHITDPSLPSLLVEADELVARSAARDALMDETERTIAESQAVRAGAA